MDREGDATLTDGKFELRKGTREKQGGTFRLDANSFVSKLYGGAGINQINS